MNKAIPSIALTVLLTLAGWPTAQAARATPTSSRQDAIDLLLNHAQYWQRHGRRDLAANNFRRVLQARPGQRLALTQLGEYEAYEGHFDKARNYMKRLKANHADAPGIRAIESMLRVGPSAAGAIAAAAQATKAQNFQSAVADYHKAFGPTPPAPWADAYFHALSRTPHSGWADAVHQARQLHNTHPHEPAYSLALGQLLIQHPRTRMQGIRLLEKTATSQSPYAERAREAWHKGLGWMGDDPQAIPYLKRYLAHYHNHKLQARLSQDLAQRTARRAKQKTGKALAHAYALVHQGQISAAESAFKTLLRQNARSEKIYEGLAIVAAKQNRFGDAAHYYRRAAHLASDAARREKLKAAAQNNTFWHWLHKGRQANQSKHYANAAQSYRKALKLKPGNSRALAALGGVYLQQGQATEAVTVFAKLAGSTPHDTDAWRGLTAALRQSGKPARIIKANKEMPRAVRKKLDQHSQYIEDLAWAQNQTGQTQRAIATLRRAAAHRQKSEATDIRLQLAWLLYDNHRDRTLYQLIQQLRQQSGLTGAQTAELKKIDFAAAGREARQALANGDKSASRAIISRLDHLYPGAPQVDRLHATLLLKTHHYKQAVALYKKAGVGNSAGDYASAAGAALAAGDDKQALHWADNGLAKVRYSDAQYPTLVHIKAQAELHRGDTAGARHTLQAALNALPSPKATTPASELNRYPFARPTQSSRNVASNYPFAGGTEKNAQNTGSGGQQRAASLTLKRRQNIQKTRWRLRTQIAAIDAQTSAQVGAGFGWRNRNGTAGLDKMNASTERVTGVLSPSYNTRLLLTANQIHLDAGSATGSAAGRVGTAPVTGAEPGTHATARGSSVSALLTTPNLNLMLGTGPLNFPVHEPVGDLDWQIPSTPLNLEAFHRNVNDSVLSYAGMKDANTGKVWGGVYASGVGLHYGQHNDNHSMYASIEASILRGRHVEHNARLQANVGESWPTYRNKRGRLDIGYDVLAMAYRHNSSHFTYGQGGYFSPSYYLRPAATFDWQGHAFDEFNYNLSARLGWQTYHNSSSAYFPTDASLQTRSVGQHFSGESKSGLAYGLSASTTYNWNKQLFLSGFLSTDNSRDYSNLVGGVKLRFTFSPQVTADGKTSLPTGIGNADIFTTHP